MTIKDNYLHGSYKSPPCLFFLSWFPDVLLIGDRRVLGTARPPPSGLLNLGLTDGSLNRCAMCNYKALKPSRLSLVFGPTCVHGTGSLSPVRRAAVEGGSYRRDQEGRKR